MGTGYFPLIIRFLTICDQVKLKPKQQQAVLRDALQIHQTTAFPIKLQKNLSDGNLYLETNTMVGEHTFQSHIKQDFSGKSKQIACKFMSGSH